jgi:hypothetical protein
VRLILILTYFLNIEVYGHPSCVSATRLKFICTLHAQIKNHNSIKSKFEMRALQKACGKALTAYYALCIDF